MITVITSAEVCLFYFTVLEFPFPNFYLTVCFKNKNLRTDFCYFYFMFFVLKNAKTNKMDHKIIKHFYYRKKVSQSLFLCLKTIFTLISSNKFFFFFSFYVLKSSLLNDDLLNEIKQNKIILHRAKGSIGVTKHYLNHLLF